MTGRQSITLTGSACDFVDFGAASSSGSGCEDGTKMVLKSASGTRQQFLLASSKTIYAFVSSGTKFPQCTSFTDRTCDIQCKAVDGADSINLSGSRRKIVELRQGIVYTGNDCEWIDLNAVSSNSGCDDGDKFVIKNKAGSNRRQFLFVEGKTILAFVPNGQKFPECTTFTEVTTSINCKAVDGGISISLPSSCGGSSPTPSPTSSPTPSTTPLAIIVTGQQKNELLYANGTKFCELPDFPDTRVGHSQHGLTTCGGSFGSPNILHKNCIKLKESGWSYNEVSLLGKRYFHESFLRPDGKIQLMSSDKFEERNSTEVVDLNAKTSVPGFDLKDYVHSYGDCSFQPGDYVVITGSYTGNQVYDINGFVKTLPSLNCQRSAHGCGYYKNNDNKLVYLVTGGRGGGVCAENLDTTELLIEGAASWIISEKKLPTERFDLVGISINNRIFMIGGVDESSSSSSYLDEVVEFDTDTEEWSLVENLREGKRFHAASVVDINIAKQFCL